METTTTLYSGAPLAKCELLARLHNNHIIPNFVPRSAAEVRANIAAAIEAARCGPAPAPRHDEKKDLYGDLGDDDELVELAAVPVPVPVPTPADGLKTPSHAARRLGISIRTLRGFVSAGDLRYVNVGRGKQREKLMFTDSDLDGFIAERSRQKAQQCQSISPRARRTTTTISNGTVVAFTARRKEPTNAKRKR